MCTVLLYCLCVKVYNISVMFVFKYVLLCTAILVGFNVYCTVVLFVCKCVLYCSNIFV
jgi:hypothetical protein